MNKNNKISIAVFVAVLAILLGIGAWIYSASGVDPPFTVVESQSMQHSKESVVGTIDTGDLILVISPSNTEIVTYVEGSKTGYSSFGEYGSVIVYERARGNPVIHRAFIWLDYNSETKTWSAPSLEGYEGSWTCMDNGISITDYNNLHGILTFNNVGMFNKTPYIDLDKLATNSPRSGYLTIGDNTTNMVFDQTNGLIMQYTISKDIIKSVAWVEFPMVGALKLYFNGKTSILNEWAPNALPTIVLTFVTIILVLFGIGYLYDVRIGHEIELQQAKVKSKRKSKR